MINSLEKIILDFSSDIKENFAGYVAIYSSFFEYIKEKYFDYEYSLNKFLEYDLGRMDIINSCVYYIKNSYKANKVTAIEKYLNAMTKLYEECFEKQHFRNRNLFAILPFGKLKSEVTEKLDDISLNEKESYSPINKEDADNILEYLSNYSRKKNISFIRNSILLKLMLLYGFKLERVKYMTVKDVDLDKHILNVQDDLYEGIVLRLELPFLIVKELQEYIKLLVNEEDFDSNQFLFLSSNKKVIDSSFAQQIFKNIKKQYTNDSNNITPTGISKYAIINMIRAGINAEKIKLITGMQDIVINDCEKRFLEQQYQSKNDSIILNREINKKIRGISIYDEMM